MPNAIMGQAALIPRPDRPDLIMAGIWQETGNRAAGKLLIRDVLFL